MLTEAATGGFATAGGGGGGGSDTEQAQFEADKRAVYKHPLFPLLALLFERCELATQSADAPASDAFNLDIQAFVQHQERDRKPFLANEPEIDGLMIKAIQVLRIHLLELEKVQELCKDFCNRYITCLKGKMQSENLLRSDYTQGGGVMSALENNNNMLHGNGNSESGSDSNSPLQYSVSPTQQPPTQQPPTQPPSAVAVGTGGLEHHVLEDATAGAEPLVVHGSTPLGQIGLQDPATTTITNMPPGCGPGVSPGPATPGGSADDCDSDLQAGPTGRKQKRGVLPKHATSVMRSWLFQHLVHPYPTEDEKRHIAAQTRLTLLQVNNWFINARRRILQPMLDAGGGGTPGGGGAAVGGDAKQQHRRRPNPGNGSRRLWPTHITPGVLSSSDDDCSSYSSDGEDGGLVIDSGGDGAPNGHEYPPAAAPPEQH